MSNGSQFIKPETLLDQSGIQPGMLVADLGCGSGYLAIPAARRVGKSGKAYAVDVQKVALSHLTEAARLEGLDNIVTVWSDVEIAGATDIPAATLDVVFLVNILFQVQNKEAVLREANRLLKPGGALVVVDWAQETTQLGPEQSKRVTEKTVRQLASQVGFKEERVIEAGSYHYGLLFRSS